MTTYTEQEFEQLYNSDVLHDISLGLAETAYGFRGIWVEYYEGIGHTLVIGANYENIDRLGQDAWITGVVQIEDKFYFIEFESGVTAGTRYQTIEEVGEDYELINRRW